MKKIAVVSQNKSLARFVELEVISCRFDCDVFLKFPIQTSEYSAVIVDTDTIDLLGINLPRNSISIGNNKDLKRNFIASLSYPFSLSKFRDVLYMCVENNKMTDLAFENNMQKESEKILFLNNDTKTLLAFGKKTSLSDYEALMLERLCETPGVAVSRNELSGLLGSYGDTNIADVYVCHLRKKFEKLTDQKVIYTIRSKGYMTHFSLSKE